MSIIETIKDKHLMGRKFTVQALSDIELLLLSVDNLKRMQQEFFEAFVQIFEDAEVLLRRLYS